MGLEKKIQRLFMTRLFHLQEKSLVVSKIRLWKMIGTDIIEKLYDIEKMIKNQDNVRFNETCLNFKNDIEKE